ncbi:GtrA family protein [Halalkalicoccus sp. NIPERK01]|uniref:GtrA family protein n=1 Tax=Halalkalicoccus sp. NIPERK01 TaxID=3053469 RepID=UPI00256F0460|nr:GtrA family protein [Halalkalicoccus sp. NIPERK01]MDL5361710.1 GtrA family protein [Halalkalicoccus sp. NIPERK01]
MVRALLRQAVDGRLATRVRRFAIVGAVAAGVQTLLLGGFVEYAGLHYLLAATIAIEITIVFQYALNNVWTFQAVKNTGWGEYLYGLFKTNVVRGSAIPIQLGVLYGLVTWSGIAYLIANVVAILVSGVYRYVLDARWTWNV